MRITRDITRALGFKTQSQLKTFSRKIKTNVQELFYSLFGGATLLLILVGAALFS